VNLARLTELCRYNKTPGSPAECWRRPAFLITAALLVFSAYANTFDSPFIFDDWLHIEGNPHIRLDSLSFKALQEAAFASPLHTRPLANLSFALNYLADGYKVAGYHLVNILIHLSCGLLVFLLMTATLETRAMQHRCRELRMLPWAAALLWLAHPLQTQSVTYIIQRMNSLSALFSLLALLGFIKARLSRTRRERCVLAAAAVLAWLLACASKEIAVSLPFFALLYDWFFIEDLRSDWLKRHWQAGLAAIVLMLTAALILLGGTPWQIVSSTYTIRDFSLGERLLTQPRVTWFYLSLLIFPHPSRLNLDHDFAISHGLFDPATTFPAMVGLLALLLLAGFGARRCRLASFAVFWFLGNLAIESSVLGLEMVFEHRTYLPSVFPVAAMVLIAFTMLKNSYCRAILFMALLFTLAFWTHARNEVWKDEVLLRQDCLAKSPAKPRNHAILANALERRGQFAEAAGHYRAALQLKPDNADEILYNLGNVLLNLADNTGAAENFTRALNITPDAAVIRLNLGVALERQGNLPAALEQYKELLRRNPNFVRGHNNLGVILMRLGRLEEAAVHFREALRLKPDYAVAQGNLLKVMPLIGKPREKRD